VRSAGAPPLGLADPDLTGRLRRYCEKTIHPDELKQRCCEMFHRVLVEQKE